jgi:hypothetical protein
MSTGQSNFVDMKLHKMAYSFEKRLTNIFKNTTVQGSCLLASPIKFLKSLYPTIQ